MKKFLSLACSSFLVGAFGSANASDTSRPNIIFFLVDDMGWQDTSVPFWKEKTPLNQIYHTPNMERLAASGMKFTQAYACAVSSPTRTSLMTGMNAARHRVTNWTLNLDQTTDHKDDVLEFPQWNVNGLQSEGGIPRTVEATTLPAILRDHGYTTIHCGKAHWGANGTPGSDPLNLGFDINIAGHAAGGPATFQGLRNFGYNEDGTKASIWAIPGLGKYHGQDINLTEALTLEAIHALDTISREKPFYLYMSHYAVHVPIEADSRFVQKYLDKGMNPTEAKYASMVEGMDKSLGDLMLYLEQNELSDNTIIIFMSDNGGLSAEGRGGERHHHNAPLNSGKGSTYEGGIREPMLVSWPGVVKPGSQCDDYLIIEDFFPSILSMAGIEKYKTVQTLDGKSFIPALHGKRINKNRSLFWHFPNNWGPKGPGISAYSTIRQGDWKLIYYHKTQSFELFNIKEDIGETNNVAAQNSRLVKKMATRLSQYLSEVEAQMPVVKATGTPVPMPVQVISN